MTMEPKRAEEAGRIIHRCWTNGDVIEVLPETCRPRTMANGYAAQCALAAVSGEPVLGWKIAATSTSGQRHINVDGPIAGRLLASRVHHSPCEVTFGANRMAVAEAEFAFVMGGDLPAREDAWPVDEVLAAVATLHPAIELPDSRFADFTRAGSAQLAADNGLRARIRARAGYRCGLAHDRSRRPVRHAVDRRPRRDHRHGLRRPRRPSRRARMDREQPRSAGRGASRRRHHHHRGLRQAERHRRGQPCRRGLRDDRRRRGDIDGDWPSCFTLGNL